MGYSPPRITDVIAEAPEHPAGAFCDRTGKMRRICREKMI